MKRSTLQIVLKRTPVGVKHQILGIKIVTTRFQSQVQLVKLENAKVFLPVRMTASIGINLPPFTPGRKDSEHGYNTNLIKIVPFEK